MTQAQKKDVTPALREGAPAPAFRDMPATGGVSLSLSDFAGKPVVLYFYPKDNTPGCTVEAKDFTCLKHEFDALGAVILGVSKDSLKKHDHFTESENLSITLLSDERGDLCEQYGVWVEKSMYGRKYMGIERATFLIDGKGVLRRIWNKVKVEGHAQEVLEAVKTL